MKAVLGFLLIASAFVLGGCASSMNKMEAYNTPPRVEKKVDVRVVKKDVDEIVPVSTRTEIPLPDDHDYAVGTIIISTKERKLLLVASDTQGVMYDVGVGREGMAWQGTAQIGDVQINPKWTPPKEMIARRPELARWADGMPGGVKENPLGTRAIYLHTGDGTDTLYRIHGTNEPKSIGEAVSSGCIRMLKADIEELYEQVELGATVIVLN